MSVCVILPLAMMARLSLLGPNGGSFLGGFGPSVQDGTPSLFVKFSKFFVRIFSKFFSFFPFFTGFGALFAPVVPMVVV